MIPINPTIGALSGLVASIALRRAPVKWIVGGLALGLAAVVYNAWKTAEWVSGVTREGGIYTDTPQDWKA